MGKAIVVGIGSGLSAVIWITVGGFAVLSTSVLVAILVASVVIPVVVAKSLQMKARRTLKKGTKYRRQQNKRTKPKPAAG